MNQYEQQATDFCNKYGVTIEITYKKHGKHWEEDKQERDIYSVYIKRGSRGLSLYFGQSLNKSGVQIVNTNNNKVKRIFPRESVTDRSGKISRMLIEQILRYPLLSCEKVVQPTPPTAYDILTCLTKYDPSTFEDFCSDFGYDPDSRRAERTYKAVKEEWNGVQALFNDEELTELQEIN